MTEHDADAVVERFVRDFRGQTRNRLTIIARSFVRSLQPGDRLPGGLVVVPEGYDEPALLKGMEAACWSFYRRENEPLVAIATTDIQAAHRAMLAAASGDT